MVKAKRKRKYSYRQRLWFGREMTEGRLTPSDMPELYGVSEQMGRRYRKEYEEELKRNPGIEYTYLRNVEPKRKRNMTSEERKREFFKNKKKSTEIFNPYANLAIYKYEQLEKELEDGWCGETRMKKILEIADWTEDMAKMLRYHVESTRNYRDNPETDNNDRSFLNPRYVLNDWIKRIIESLLRIYDAIMINLGSLLEDEEVLDNDEEEVGEDDRFRFFMLKNKEGFVVKTPLVYSQYHTHQSNGGSNYIKEFNIGHSILVQKMLNKYDDQIEEEAYEYKSIDVVEVFNKKMGRLPDGDNLDTKKIIDAITQRFATKDDSPFTKFSFRVLLDQNIPEGTYFVIKPCKKEDIFSTEMLRDICFDSKS